MKPFDVKANTYTDFDVEENDKNPKFAAGDNVRISKYQNIFAKWYTPNWSKDCFDGQKRQEHCTMDICHWNRQKNYQKSLGSRKYWREMDTNSISNRRDMVIHSTAALI